MEVCGIVAHLYSQKAMLAECKNVCSSLQLQLFSILKNCLEYGIRILKTTRIDMTGWNVLHLRMRLHALIFAFDFLLFNVIYGRC